MNTEAAIHAYCRALENAGPHNLDELLELCADSIEFRDPFNHTFTRDRYRDVLEHMFRTIQNVRFDVERTFGEGDVWMVKWTFTGHARLIGPLRIHGVSEVALDGNSRVIRHIDYWDARTAILDKLPIVGWILRLLLRPTAV